MYPQIITRFRWQSAYIEAVTAARMRLGGITLPSGVSYSNILNVAVCDGGLRLSCSLLFRLGHPPLFIPWSEMIAVRSPAPLRKGKQSAKDTCYIFVGKAHEETKIYFARQKIWDAIAQCARVETLEEES